MILRKQPGPGDHTRSRAGRKTSNPKHDAADKVAKGLTTLEEAASAVMA